MTIRDLIVPRLLPKRGELPDPLALAVLLHREFNSLLNDALYDEPKAAENAKIADQIQAALPEANRNLLLQWEEAEIEELNLHLTAAFYWFMTGNLPDSEADIETARNRASDFSTGCS